jgi:YVTN family beta-propeller protein
LRVQGTDGVTYDLGVDLGTTFVAAALARPNQAEMFTLGDRSVVTPSVVYRADDGRLISGDAANRRAVSNPERTVREFKRRLGDPTPVMLAGTEYTVSELIGAVLGDVLRKVTETEGEPPGRVVLTHPANWGPFRRGLLEEVPAMVGLTDVGLITEPEGAAAHYASTRRLTDGELVAVYDLGGGTFDATVLRSGPAGVEILGMPEGIERLGGIDFDEAILSHVNVVGGGALDALDRRDPQAAVALDRLRQDCVLAKETLSRDTETVIPVFLPGRQFEVRLTRAEFEDMIKVPIESSITALTRALASAQVTPADLSGVLLVGGSSRIPLVARMVSEALGRPTVVDTHPKYAVALGAAVVARAQRGEQTLTQRSSDTAAKGGKDVGSPARRKTGGSTRSRRWPAPVAAVVVLAAIVGGVLAVPHIVGSGPASGDQTAAALAPISNTPPLASAPIPMAGSPLPAGDTPGFAAVSPNGRLLYVANGDAKELNVLDTTTNTKLATVPIPDGPPQFLTFSPDGSRLYVSIFDVSGAGSEIAVLDTSTNQVLGQIPVAGQPYRLAVTADARELIVPVHNPERVWTIDTVSLKVTGQIPVPPDPSWVELSIDGRKAYVVNRGANLITVLDPASGRITGQVPVGAAPNAVAVNPRQPLLAVVNFNGNSVTLLDASTDTVTTTIPVGQHPQALAWAADGRFLYVVNDGDNTVSTIDPGTGKITATVPTAQTPTSISVLPDGTRAYVTNLTSGTLTLLNLAG